MSVSKETWDLYDERGCFAGTITRGKPMPPGHYHIAVEVIVTDTEGHILVTKRSGTKRRDPNKYEFPAGSVLAGETPEHAAKRELWEETGLLVESVTRIQVNTKTSRTGAGLQRQIFTAVIPDLLTRQITLQPGETTEYRFITFPQWYQMKLQGQFSPERSQIYNEDVINFLKRNTVMEDPTSTLPQRPVSMRKISIQEMRKGLNVKSGNQGNSAKEKGADK